MKLVWYDLRMQARSQAIKCLQCATPISMHTSLVETLWEEILTRGLVLVEKNWLEGTCWGILAGGTGLGDWEGPRWHC